jgi:transcription initiation factor TFIIH subunit 4
MERHREGFLVVETNYRIYAYTNSDLQVALIGLFAELLYRLIRQGTHAEGKGLYS